MLSFTLFLQCHLVSEERRWLCGHNSYLVYLYSMIWYAKPWSFVFLNSTIFFFKHYICSQSSQAFIFPSFTLIGLASFLHLHWTRLVVLLNIFLYFSIHDLLDLTSLTTSTNSVGTILNASTYGVKPQSVLWSWPNKSTNSQIANSTSQVW